jgi:hypothetical protein
MVLRRSAAAAACFLFLMFGALRPVAAQSGPPSVSAPQQTTSETTNGKPGGTSGKTTAIEPPSATPPKAHKVITNDDIDAARARPEKYTVTEPVTGTGTCDEDCALQVRQTMGYGPSQEGEWQIQIAAARYKLSNDTDWQRAYAEGGRRTKDYCNFQYQQEAAVLPSGNDFYARVDRAKRQQYVESMGRVLRQSMDGARVQMSRLMEAVQPVEPVRAAVMNVLAYRVLSTCNGDR